jgi:AraC-like DNA-binding protein
VEGLETGADDYLTKPFDPRELRVRVRNLIEGRQKLREQFGRQVTLEPKAIAITSADEKFLARAVEAVERHLGDPDFSVERFEEAMTMSKLQLYRTLKALTDQSPSEFIRNLRLKRAAALLAARSGSVAEITYAVGFNNRRTSPSVSGPRTACRRRSTPMAGRRWRSSGSWPVHNRSCCVHIRTSGCTNPVQARG